MTSHESSILAKYHRLEEAIRRLIAIRGQYTKAQFISTAQAHDTALYNLVIAVEAITDIGNHVLAEQFHDYAKQYKDILFKLGQHAVVPTALVDKTIGMADFRNLAIHVYEGLSLEKVYDILGHAPEEFREYAQALYGHIK